MKVNEKIRFLREMKEWTQEEMAEKLGMSTYGYSKIERGETRLNIPKLENICEILDVDILELMSMGERNVVYFQENENTHNNSIIVGSSSELSAEINRLKLENSHKDEIIRAKDDIINNKIEIIEAQKREIQHLQQMIELIKQA